MDSYYEPNSAIRRVREQSFYTNNSNSKSLVKIPNEMRKYDIA